MTHDEHDAFDSHWWEAHYQQAGTSSASAASPYVLTELADLTPGTALDVGCGPGADARWLAGQGWQVTALDISPTAIDQARDHDEESRVTWIAADVMSWPTDQRFDVVLSQYVHPHGPFTDFVRRLGELVAPGGTLLVVGHDEADAHSREHAPRDPSMPGSSVAEVLDVEHWQQESAVSRQRTVRHDGRELIMHDTVVKARRRA